MIYNIFSNVTYNTDYVVSLCVWSRLLFDYIVTTDYAVSTFDLTLCKFIKTYSLPQFLLIGDLNGYLVLLLDPPN